MFLDIGGVAVNVAGGTGAAAYKVRKPCVRKHNGCCCGFEVRCRRVCHRPIVPSFFRSARRTSALGNPLGFPYIAIHAVVHVSFCIFRLARGLNRD